MTQVQPASISSGRHSPYADAQPAWRHDVHRERPSPRSVIFFLALFLLPVSLVPATYGISVRIPPMPNAWWTVYLVILFAAVAVPFRLLVYSKRMRPSTIFYFLVPFLLLGGWQAASLAWNSQSMYLRGYSLLQSIGMCAAVFGATVLCSGLSFHTRVRIASGLTILVAFVLFVYVGLSFVFPSLRPTHGLVDRTVEGLGFIRVFGPLGRSTTLNFAILPALGFSVGMVFVRHAARRLWLILAAFFVMSIVSTGSRGGILCVAVFAFFLLFLGRFRMLLILVPFGFILALVIAVAGIPERFKTLEDSARLTTYETAWNAYRSSVGSTLFGTGHGALYTKLHDDSTRKALGEDRWYLLYHLTEYGYSLRNSHSAIIRSLVETGPLGLLLTTVPLAWVLLRPLSRSFKSAKQPYRMFMRPAWAGSVAVIPYLFLEEFFVSGFWIVVIWCVYAVCITEPDEETAGGPAAVAL